MKHHLRSLSASTFQMVVNQASGLLFFLGMAVLLPKDLFGQVNWSVAVCASLTIISSLGFDHIIVRKLSSGSPVSDTVGIYIGHTFLIAAVAIGGLLAYLSFAPASSHYNLSFIGIYLGLLATFLSMPYKQLANGRERFWHLAFMGISGNIIRVAILAILFLTQQITAASIGFLFFVAGILEWIVCMMLAAHFSGKVPGPVVKLKKYTVLVREALPQMGVILLDSAFARVDWILMGILSTHAFTADYSFSYKAYESSRLPLLVIAPVILPKVSRMYSQGGISPSGTSGLHLLWRAESLICVLIPLLLNVCWEDAVNFATQGRYGTSTKWVYAVLSLSLPMVYIINFMWTIAFSQGRLKMVFYFTALTLCSNLILNVCLIPFMGALGAAIAFTGSTALQLILYTSGVREPVLNVQFSDFLKTTLGAGIIICLTAWLPIHWIVKVPLSLTAFGLYAWLIGMVHWRKPYIVQKYPA